MCRRRKTLKTQSELIETADHVPDGIRRFWARERPLEIKPVNLQHYTSRDKLPPHQNIWISTNGQLPDDRPLQCAVLAYLSDMTLLDTSTFAHGRAIFDPDIQVGQPRPRHVVPSAEPLDDWLLYAQDSPSSSGARGLRAAPSILATAR
jgi:acyl-CoA thioesterase II